MKDDNSSFALIAWLKKQQEISLQENAERVLKHFKDDELFAQVLQDSLRMWHELSDKEKTMLLAFISHRQRGYNFTSPMRAVIGSFYIKLQTRQVG